MMTGARPSVGSSSRRSRAPVRRMRPLANICCSPPESLVPWLLGRSFKFGKSSKIRSSDSPPGRTCRGNSKFSLTSRVEKMPRSSGQNAMPARAMALDGRLINSAPSNRTEPVRLSMMPMMALSVVVLPTPLRPSSVTTSPGCTSKVTPCRMCDSPYQASSPCTASMACVEGEVGSSMAGSKIGLTHGGIGRYGLIIPFGEDLAAGEHGDAVAEICHHAEVMLDHQHGARCGDGSDQSADAADVVMAHTRCRLVKQQHFRIERQRGCDFERPLVAIGQFDRERIGVGRKADIGDQRKRALIERAKHALAPPEIERA